MRIKVSTRFAADPERVWAELQKPALLRHIASPLIMFHDLQGALRAERFADGRARVLMLAFGVLPLGRQWINVSRPDLGDGVRRIRDDGSGDLVRRWDHWIAISPHPDGGTLYEDEVTIEAGVLTPLIWAYAALFYRWRQHRWRRLIARDFRY